MTHSSESRNARAGVERGVMCREGEYWTVTFQGTTARLRDNRGLTHLAVLLEHPHRPIPSLTLAEGGVADGPLQAPHDPAARERARVSVTRAVHSALRRIAPQLPELAAHLEATVRTGGNCSYAPDPRVPIVWEVSIHGRRPGW